jgi:hypothetical protein
MSRLERNIYRIMSEILSFHPHCLTYQALCPETKFVTSFTLKMQATTKTTVKKIMFASSRLKNMTHKLMPLNLDQIVFVHLVC